MKVCDLISISDQSQLYKLWYNLMTGYQKISQACYQIDPAQSMRSNKIHCRIRKKVIYNSQF